MRAIVTGAGGFLGRSLVSELLDADYRVAAVVRNKGLFHSKCPREWIDEGRLDVVECDMGEYSSLPNQIDPGDVDFFFHFAWDGVSGDGNKSADRQERNVMCALDTVAVAHQLGCKRYVGAGSIHESEVIFEMESGNGQGLTSPYKAAKLAAHYLCQGKAESLGIEFLWPRITNAYGVGEHSGRLVSMLVDHLLDGASMALTSCHQIYNFIYVTDCARAFRLIAEKGISGRQYIVGSEDLKPLRCYLEELRSIIAPAASLGLGELDVKPICLPLKDLYSPELFEDTGFVSRVSFSQGIKMIAVSLNNESFR